MIQYNVYQVKPNGDLAFVSSDSHGSVDAAISAVVTQASNGLEFTAIPVRYLRSRKVTVESKPTVTLTAAPDPTATAPEAPAAPATGPTGAQTAPALA